MADFEPEISAVQTKRPRLEQDGQISSSSLSYNAAISDVNSSNMSLPSSGSNSTENCSSSVKDFRPTTETVRCSSSIEGGDSDHVHCNNSEETQVGPRPRQNCDDDTVSMDNVPSSSTTTRPTTTTSTIDQPTGSNLVAADNDSEDSDVDLDLNLGNWTPQPAKGPLGWLQRQMMMGMNPHSILSKFLPGTVFPEGMDDFQLWSLLVEYFEYLSEPKRRSKLEAYNTMDDVIRLLQSCTKIMVLTGAGVSVSCGIPDFRSRDGIYARLSKDFPDLPDPQSMFDIHYFRRDPRPFFKFAKEIYPGQFKPSVNHQFISVLEQQGKLLRNYTQNIDTLEQVAGISRVIQCHGSFASASCTRCKHKADADTIREDIFNQVVPVCPNCPQDNEVMAVMKPDIVFFGEGLPNSFYESLDDDKSQADLIIVIGSSLKVRPVATIPNILPHDIPQILINREPLPHMTFDIELLGDSDIIVNELCRRLGDGWNQICHTDVKLEETSEIPVSARRLFETMPTPPYIHDDSVEVMNEMLKNGDTGKHNSSDVRSDLECYKPFSENVFVETDAAHETNQNNACLQINDDQSCEKDARVNDAQEIGHSLGKPLNNDEGDISNKDSQITKTENEHKVESQTEPVVEKASSSKSVHERDVATGNGEEEGRVVTKKRSRRRYSRDSIATHLEPSTFLFIPPNRYIFHGAEVYPDSDSDDETIAAQSSSHNALPHSTHVSPPNTSVQDPGSSQSTPVSIEVCDNAIDNDNHSILSSEKPATVIENGALGDSFLHLTDNSHEPTNKCNE